MLKTIAALLAAAIAGHAQASETVQKPGMRGANGGQVSAGTLALTNVSVPIGAVTQTGRGTVRLSSPGLGLISSGTVACWKVSETDANTGLGYWKFNTSLSGTGTSGTFSNLTATPVSIVEGFTAVTPTPTAAGVSASLGTGPYTFLVTGYTDTNCTLGAASATLTYTISPSAITFGSTDYYPGDGTAGMGRTLQVPSTWLAASGTPITSNVSIQLAVGADWTYSNTAQAILPNIASLTFAHNGSTPYVTLKNADNARPAVLQGVNVNLSNYLNIDGLNFTGDQVALASSSTASSTFLLVKTPGASSVSLGDSVTCGGITGTVLHQPGGFKGGRGIYTLSASVAYVALGTCLNNSTGATFTGQMGGAQSPINSAISVNGSFINVSNITETHTLYTLNPNANTILLSGCSTCALTNISADYVGGCIQEGQNAIDTGITVNNLLCRHYANNALITSNISNSTFNDITLIAPMRVNDFHIDSWQFADYTSPTNLTINRIESYTADGTATAQGLPFAGSTVAFTGFIDDGLGSGTYDGTAGTVLTITAIASGTVFSGGTPILDTLGLAASGTKIIAKGTGTGGAGTYTVNNSQAVPSSTFYFGPLNIAVNGMIYVGRTINSGAFNDMAGVTFKNFVNAYADTGKISTTQFLGSASTTSLTVSQILATTWQDAETGIAYDGNSVLCSTFAQPLCGTSIPSPPIVQSQSSGYSEGAGSWTLSPTLGAQTFGAGTLFSLTEDGQVGGVGPRLVIANSDLAYLYPVGNSSSFTSGWSQYGINYLKANRTAGTLPPGVTLGTGFTAGDNTYSVAGVKVFTLTPVYPAILSGIISSGAWSTLVTSYGGSPDLFLNAITPTQWGAMTVAQIKAVHASLFTPNPGGACDAAPGTPGVTAWCAFTFAGKWNDGSGLTP
jgi:hypothetical protein